MEGGEGRPTGRPNVPATPRRPKRPPPRGQPRRLLRLDRTHVTFPGNDRGAPPTLVPVGQLQHPHHALVHHIRGEHVGRQAHPALGQR
jgi:hypothetical protein